MTEQTQLQQAPAPVDQALIDEFIAQYLAEHQNALMQLVIKHNARANELQLPFPVLLFYISSSVASACYELLKMSGTEEHNPDSPKALTEEEQEVMKMMKVQLDAGWDTRLEMFSSQERLNQAIAVDGDVMLAAAEADEQPKH